MLLDADNNPIINGGANKSAPLQNTHSNTVADANQAKAIPQAHISAMDLTSSLFVWIALFLALYWFFIRPQKKRQEQLIDFQSKLKPGDDVVTSAGLHGKIIEVEEKTFLIEFGVNKSVRIPISKNHIMAMDESEEQ